MEPQHGKINIPAFVIMLLSQIMWKKFAVRQDNSYCPAQVHEMAKTAVFW